MARNRGHIVLKNPAYSWFETHSECPRALVFKGTLARTYLLLYTLAPGEASD